MPAPSLREIEQSLSSLWLRESVRQSFAKGASESVPPTIASSIDVSGVELYAELLKFGQQDLMASIYPYTARLLKNKWQACVSDYFLQYPANHYNLNRAASRFSTYLKRERRDDLLKKHPFIAELADYEWIELELLEMDHLIEAQPNLVLSKPEQFTQYAPLVNPVLILRQYTYPISQIAQRLEGKRSVAKIKPEASRVAVFRHPTTNQCKFLDVGEVAFEIIQASSDIPHSYAELITLAVSRAPDVDPQQSITEFLDLMETLQELQLFIGNTKLA